MVLIVNVRRLIYNPPAVGDKIQNIKKWLLLLYIPERGGHDRIIMFDYDMIIPLAKYIVKIFLQSF